MCNCGTVETTVYYLLHCPSFLNKRLTLYPLTLFNNSQSIDEISLSKDDSNISKVLPYGDYSFKVLCYLQFLKNTKYV